MRVTHDICRSLLVNKGELILSSKATFSTDLCGQKQPLKMINGIKNLQIHRHETRVSKILNLRH